MHSKQMGWVTACCDQLSIEFTLRVLALKRRKKIKKAVCVEKYTS